MPSGKLGSGAKFGDHCRDCGVEITPLNAIYKNHYLQPRCKSCNRAHANNVPSRTKEARAAQYIRWRWGISIEEFQERAKEQGNVCAICKQKCDTGRKLAIDHDHSTNEIREFLCMRCNTIIGRSEENIELLEQIIEYIKRHSVENKLRAV